MKKKLIALSVTAMALIAGAIPALAEDFDATSIMTAGLNDMKSTALPIIGIAVGAGLAIFGVIFGIRKAISALRSTAGG
jgi:hypothetical protein